MLRYMIIINDQQRSETMNSINFHIYLFDLTADQKQLIEKLFAEKLVKQEERDVLYISSEDLSPKKKIQELAQEQALSLNLHYMDAHRHIYGIEHYRNGQKEEIEVDDLAYYKLTEELLDIQYFDGLDVNDSEFLKAVASCLTHYSYQSELGNIQVTSIFQGVVRALIQGQSGEVILSLDKDTGVVTVEYEGRTVKSLDIRGDDGLEVFENFIEDEILVLLDSKRTSILLGEAKAKLADPNFCFDNAAFDNIEYVEFNLEAPENPNLEIGSQLLTNETASFEYCVPVFTRMGYQEVSDLKINNFYHTLNFWLNYRIKIERTAENYVVMVDPATSKDRILLSLSDSSTLIGNLNEEATEKFIAENLIYDQRIELMVIAQAYKDLAKELKTVNS